jgi:hypothetical protein
LVAVALRHGEALARFIAARLGAAFALANLEVTEPVAEGLK